MLVVTTIYFLPAALGWFFIAGLGLRELEDFGHPASGVAASLCGALGAAALGVLLLRQELIEARKAHRKW
jgi:hypothetical protein